MFEASISVFLLHSFETIAILSWHKVVQVNMKIVRGWRQHNYYAIQGLLRPELARYDPKVLYLGLRMLLLKLAAVRDRCVRTARSFRLGIVLTIPVT